MLRSAQALCGVSMAAGHASMITPHPWQNPDGKLEMPDARNIAGCTGKRAPGQKIGEATQGCLPEWYSNYTHIPGEPTIGATSPLTTIVNCVTHPTAKWCDLNGTVLPGIGVVDLPDWTKKNPWRAPGTAPVWSPCGVDGGNPWGCPKGNPKPDGCLLGGYGYGPDARTLPDNNTVPTKWTAGEKVEVQWSITANHGGGYQYRLCPLPATGRIDLTEECFQQTPLAFVGDNSWYEFDNKSRVEFKAVRTSEGTMPAGSTWTRNPTPGCISSVLGPFSNGDFTDCGGGPEYEPVVEGMYGFSYSASPSHRFLSHTIVDLVQVPDVPPGAYVVGFRYDAEQTSQVWQSCGDVYISSSKSMVV